jgi:hypothetical protein
MSPGCELTIVMALKVAIGCAFGMFKRLKILIAEIKPDLSLMLVSHKITFAVSNATQITASIRGLQSPKDVQGWETSDS